MCDMTLDKKISKHFESAVTRQYWYELFLDDLPMWGMVGESLRDDAGNMEKVFIERDFYSTSLSVF